MQCKPEPPEERSEFGQEMLENVHRSNANQTKRKITPKRGVRKVRLTKNFKIKSSKVVIDKKNCLIFT